MVSIEEIVHPFLPYLSKLLMIHFNKVREGRWIGMNFIPQFHGIYCLSFHLKHEGMKYFVDNFKISRMIWNTKFLKKISIHVYPNKVLGGCNDMLLLTYGDMQRPTFSTIFLY